MTIRVAHAAADGARIYHDDAHAIAAIVGSPRAILDRYRRSYRDFDLYAVPHDRVVVLVRFDVGLDEVGRAATLVQSERWLSLAACDLAAIVEPAMRCSP